MSKIKCLKCNTVLESLHVHDFRECRCHSVFIDGGNEYLRMGWPGGNKAEWIEIIEYPPEQSK